MLILDCIYSSMLFVYILIVGLILICLAWTTSRYEAKHHMTYFVVVSLGLALSLPLVIIDLELFRENPDNYANSRIGYYTDGIAKTLPCALYLLMKPAEDCFNCFNRLAP